MEDYDREFLTFTVKDEPEDSEEDFIGFEDVGSSYVDMYKQFVVVKDEFQRKDVKPPPEVQKATIRKVPQIKVVRKPAIVRKMMVKPVAAKIKVESQKDEPMDVEQQGETNAKSVDVKMRTDIEIIVMGSFPDSGTKVNCVYNCDICGAKYTRKSKLRTHILNHVVKGPNELPLCEYCGEVFDSIDKFFEHIMLLRK